MRAVDLIHKKRLGEPLTREEIKFLVDGYVNGQIPDYQMSALCMAIVFQGMDEKETADLTQAIVESGEQIDLSEIPGVKVDKHSTGGVGDTTTLVLGPLVAALGVPVAKMSGRGLGHTGGTIDKMESIPGLRTDLSMDALVKQVKDIGVAVAGQTANLTPADKLLYGLRDVTDTVESIPLIASSIMSKKLASGADAIVLDVKVGEGAFMKDLEHARRLARAMVSIGSQSNRQTVAVLTSMEEPLGRAIGNALEVREAIQTLRGEGPEDLTELCLTLGAEMVVLAGKAETVEDARHQLKEVMENGKALRKFKEFIKAQGGDERVADDMSLLPKAPVVVSWHAPIKGFVKTLHAEELGRVAMRLGAGRSTHDEEINPAVGLVVQRKVGQPVHKDEAVVEVHAGTKEDAEQALRELDACIEIVSDTVDRLQLVFDVIREEDSKASPEIDSKGLLQAARDAMKQAYVPYSNFQVGAALLLSSGDVVTGANMENASYGLTNCAERTAVFRALMRPCMPSEEKIIAVAVVADSDGPVSPCGACRQVLSEFCDANVPVWLGDLRGGVLETTMEGLLPYSFQKHQMEG